MATDKQTGTINPIEAVNSSGCGSGVVATASVMTWSGGIAARSGRADPLETKSPKPLGGAGGRRSYESFPEHVKERVPVEHGEKCLCWVCTSEYLSNGRSLAGTAGTLAREEEQTYLFENPMGWRLAGMSWATQAEFEYYLRALSEFPMWKWGWTEYDAHELAKRTAARRSGH